MSINGSGFDEREFAAVSELISPTVALTLFKAHGSLAAFRQCLDSINAEAISTKLSGISKTQATKLLRLLEVVSKEDSNSIVKLPDHLSFRGLLNYFNGRIEEHGRVETILAPVEDGLCFSSFFAKSYDTENGAKQEERTYGSHFRYELKRTWLKAALSLDHHRQVIVGVVSPETQTNDNQPANYLRLAPEAFQVVGIELLAAFHLMKSQDPSDPLQGITMTHLKPPMTHEFG